MNKKLLILITIILIINWKPVKKIKQEPVLINGNCTSGRPMGDIRVYNHLIYIPENELGFIRVRSTPLWDITRNTNVLGTIKCGTYVPAWGPTKGVPSAGIGYIIPVIDENGKMCRGYVSFTVIEVIKEKYFNDGEYFKGFPDPL